MLIKKRKGANSCKEPYVQANALGAKTEEILEKAMANAKNEKNTIVQKPKQRLNKKIKAKESFDD